ncbi:glutamate--cysteine ligase [Rhodanobacter thiooxydans]|uniref:Putative glutamate--cysteine ligase 2 n=1 Tax=Rhodanobacter thiooxydans TaxID=416169 RepID=A0A154QJG3_9GAMM|nr:carboxylate-amine ligase [Rhodanobacter thiooxydans]EIM02426.1 glutamate--cysteine ligase [Rhodanobacter thiooxydans LCS2]KZC24392.1 glutamate--cysteine ligase [Rhodanobacter thiooxydans]MCW0200765.1 carboxylate-amine ligase [Rhodanobacter thiooxydans]
MATEPSSPYTFGLEEEFFLVSPATRRAPSRVPKAFLQRCRQRFGACIGSELLQSQIELSSPVFEHMATARTQMARLRRGLTELADSAGLRIVAAGTHPLSAWHQQTQTDRSRYARIIDDFQMVGRRNLLCGLHVHVAPPTDVDRVALMNRLMPWLPLFLALSTSSPFWNRRCTGLLSYRQSAYDEWPRSGIPDFFADEAEYRTFCELLTRVGAIKDASFLWWAIRPAHRYPTLELRIADACTHLEDALALAALFRCLVRAHVRRPELGQARTALTRRIIDENRWRAKRFGPDASFIDETTGGVVECVRVLDAAIELVSEDAHELDCEVPLRHLNTIVTRGTSAQQQLVLYHSLRNAGSGNIEALRAVIDWLAETSISVSE